MIRLVTLLVLVGVLSLPAHAKESRETVQDTSSSSMSFFEIISWPFIHVIQPFFGRFQQGVIIISHAEIYFVDDLQQVDFKLHGRKQGAADDDT